MNAPQRLPVQNPVSYSESKAAEYLNCTVEQLRRLRRLNQGPVFTYSPATDEYLYSPESLNAWLRALHGGGAA